MPVGNVGGNAFGRPSAYEAPKLNQLNQGPKVHKEKPAGSLPPVGTFKATPGTSTGNITNGSNNDPKPITPPPAHADAGGEHGGKKGRGLQVNISG
jgi:hypothetical protein